MKVEQLYKSYEPERQKRRKAVKNKLNGIINKISRKLNKIYNKYCPKRVLYIDKVRLFVDGE